MRAIVRRAEGLSASPGSYPQSRPRASSARHKSTPPSVGIQGRILPAVESSPRPPRCRGKATTKNGEENKHSDSPDPVDDTQTVRAFYRRREHRTRRTTAGARMDPPHGEIISFDRSTRSEADGIQWRGTLRAALFLRPSIVLIL